MALIGLIPIIIIKRLYILQYCHYKYNYLLSRYLFIISIHNSHIFNNTCFVEKFDLSRKRQDT